MLENTKRNSRDFSVYDKMATEDLKLLLLADINSDDQVTDMEVLCYVTELITKRENESGIPRKTTQDAYAEFREKYMYSDGLADAEDIENPSENVEVSVPKAPSRVIPFIKRLPRIAVIAIAVLAFSATLVMSVDALRIPILRFVNTHFHNHSLLSVAEQTPEYYPHSDPNEAVKDAPVPEGFKLQLENISDSSIRIYYSDKESNYLSVSILSSQTVVKYNSEGYENSCVTVNGQVATFLVKDDDMKLIWLDEKNDVYYMLAAKNLSIEELFRIADYWAIQRIRIAEG